MSYINRNTLADLGLLERINKEILHPLGLTVCRTVEDGTSLGALISNDGKWEYSADIQSKIKSDDEVLRLLMSITPDGKLSIGN